MPSPLPLLLLLAHGLPDRGIFPEYDRQVSLALPGWVRPAHPWLRLDPAHGVLTLHDGADALKAWPIALPPGAHPARLDELDTLDAARAAAGRPILRPADRAELLGAAPPTTAVVTGPPARDEDHDGDGLVDRLDALIGARKLLENRATYVERYRALPYPGGDVPRDEGVCTDTVIRALRNAGIDLQREVHEDILRAPRAYPMVDKPNASIDHRRVRTILPWFERHFRTVPEGAPLLPGDVVFLDTFPRRDGPDHLGVVSDRAPAGRPLVINNWTVGTTDAEMDLLTAVPVTHRFRPRPPQTAAAPRQGANVSRGW